MATSIGHLAAIVSANTLGFTAGMQAAQKGVTSFLGTLGGLAKTGGALLGLGTIAGTVKKAFEGFTGNERDQITFSALLGNAERAKTLVDELEDAGRKTTFADAFMDGAKELLKFNVAADDVVPTLDSLKDIAAGANVPLADLARTFGEVRTKNALTTKQLVSLQEQGFPVIQELTKILGTSEEGVKDLVEGGRVGFTAFEAAIASATQEGGRFHGSNERLNKSLGGGLGRVVQNVGGVISEFGETLGNTIAKFFGFEGGLKDVGDWLANVAKNMDSLQPSIENVLGMSVRAVGGWLSDLTGITFADVVASLDWLRKAWSFFWNNFGDIVKVGALKAVLFLTEFMNDAVHLFTVTLPEVARWFSRNWVEVFTDLFRYIGTIFENLGTNIVNVFKSLPGLIAGTTSWDAVWKPLTEGFVPTIKEALKLTGREATEFEKGLRQRIGGLQNDLAKGWAEAMKRDVAQGLAEGAAQGAKAGVASIKSLSGFMGGVLVGAMARAGTLKDGKAGRADGPRFAGAFEAGSKEAYNLILSNRAMEGGPAAQTAKNTAEMNRKAGQQVAVLTDIKKGLENGPQVADNFGVA
jgi:hypothetical protein